MNKEVGRPSKVSTELAKRIASMILQGQTERASAEAAGIDGASFYDYLRRGKAGDPAYADFLRIILEAKEQRKTWRKPTAR